MKEDRKEIIYIGQNQIYLENDILYVTVVGDTDETIALRIKETELGLMENRGVTNKLININHSGKVTVEARKIFKKKGEHEKTGKVALVGLHMVARVFATFLIKAFGNKRLRFFQDREEALAWLKNSKE